ncbi:MAG: glutamine synthetase family protein [Alphaproteobacteria bacterium]|nr:glutamine synthetase family protein [Alphaproteobacteria bacterium]
MHRHPLIMVCTCEIAGRVRGKGFPAGDLPSRLVKGVGWVPTNTMISCFGPIYSTPFGTTDDLMLVPDPATEVNVEFGDNSANEHFFLGDIRHLDGKPWSCCPRDFLRRGLAALKAETGLDLVSAFEHEFVYTGVEDAPGAPYSLDAYRRQGIFAEALIAALRSAGTEPDSFMPEFGARQYEVVVDPATGIASADRAVVLREMTRATAHRLGHRAIFAPILAPDGVGNGVHVHFSLRDGNGRPAMYDAEGHLGLSLLGARFVAGVMHHLPALCAITAPSAVSYIRMRPNRWAPTHATLATQDRGAAMRVCPIWPGGEPGRQFNVEYRCADAAASPYLALGAIVWAGVDGIRHHRKLPHGEGAALPADLGTALDALEATAEAKTWFGETYLAAYLMHKRGELASLAGLDEAEQCARYAATY